MSPFSNHFSDEDKDHLYAAGEAARADVEESVMLLPSAPLWESPDSPLLHHRDPWGFVTKCDRCGGAGHYRFTDGMAFDCICGQRICPYCLGRGDNSASVGASASVECGACKGYGYQVYQRYMEY